MKRKTFLAGLVLAFAACAGWAQTLTPAQLSTLRANVLANADTLALYNAGDRAGLAAAYNAAAAPAFIYWRSDVTTEEIGNAWVGTDIDGMSALNMQRLELLLASAPGGIFDMTRADRRAGFENPFGTNTANASRVAMRAVWKRSASRFERLFATGVGSDASPGALTLRGPVTPELFVEI